MALIAVVGLIASFHAIIFAMGGRSSRCREPDISRLLSVTHGDYKTPNMSPIVGGLVGLAVMLIVWFTVGRRRARSFIGGVLLNMAVFGAMFSYLLQGISFISFAATCRTSSGLIAARSALLGAALTMIIALVTVGYQLADPVYRTGVIAVASWLCSPSSTSRLWTPGR